MKRKKAAEQINVPGHWRMLDGLFYEREDVVTIAKELLGKIIVTQFDALTAARIVETEAYNGINDKASHAYNNRRTNRTEIMFGPGGAAYVYLCYGIHHLFNVVTNTEGTPHAVLIRAAEPLLNVQTMLLRTGKQKPDFSLTRGPGNVSKALGINTYHSGQALIGQSIFIMDDGYRPQPADIIEDVRIGVGYAAEDALLPYRFYLRGNGYVSGKKLLK